MSDRIGFLPARQANKPPQSDAGRGSRGADQDGEAARCCASCPTISTPEAQEIADLYKRRWAIELFFRWVKQTLKITHFLGVSENAIRIQIAVALIAFLLLPPCSGGPNPPS